MSDQRVYHLLKYGGSLAVVPNLLRLVQVLKQFILPLYFRLCSSGLNVSKQTPNHDVCPPDIGSTSIDVSSVYFNHRSI